MIEADNENEEIVQFNLRIPKSLKDRIKVSCENNMRPSLNSEAIYLFEKALSDPQAISDNHSLSRDIEQVVSQKLLDSDFVQDLTNQIIEKIGGDIGNNICDQIINALSTKKLSVSLEK